MNPADVISEEQYLVQEPQAEYRSEWRDGKVTAMSGASRAHGTIAANLLFELRSRVGTAGCDVFLTDMRVQVANAKLYTYPDVVVVCGEPKFADAAETNLLNPTVLIEILSKSTGAYDRGQKFADYQTLDSLREYVLVDQYRRHVEHYVREAGGRWVREELVGGELTLPSLGCRVPLEAVYQKVF